VVVVVVRRVGGAGAEVECLAREGGGEVRLSDGEEVAVEAGYEG